MWKYRLKYMIYYYDLVTLSLYYCKKVDLYPEAC
jgi:hypothetical protein